MPEHITPHEYDEMCKTIDRLEKNNDSLRAALFATEQTAGRLSLERDQLREQVKRLRRAIPKYAQDTVRVSESGK